MFIIHQWLVMLVVLGWFCLSWGYMKCSSGSGGLVVVVTANVRVVIWIVVGLLYSSVFLGLVVVLVVVVGL